MLGYKDISHMAFLLFFLHFNTILTYTITIILLRLHTLDLLNSLKIWSNVLRYIILLIYTNYILHILRET